MQEIIEYANHSGSEKVIVQKTGVTVEIGSAGALLMSVLFFSLGSNYFHDNEKYTVPVHTFNGGDFEKQSVPRLLQSGYRTPALILIPYAPARSVKSLEGWFEDHAFVPDGQRKAGAFLPYFRNLYDAKGRLTEKYEYTQSYNSVLLLYYYRFTWNERNQLVEYQSYNDSGAMLEWRKYRYDVAGRLIEQDFLPGENSKSKFTWSPDGRLASCDNYIDGKYKPEYKTSFQNGKMMSESQLIATYGDIISTITYKYDSAGRIAEKFVKQVEAPADVQKEIYTWDKTGRLIQLDHYDKWSDDKVYLTARYRYNYTGKEWTEELHYDAEDKLTKSLKRIYDAKGRLVQQDTYYHDADYGGPVERWMATYDEAGNPVQETVQIIDGYTNKLAVQDKLIMTWTSGARITGWDMSHRNSDGKMVLEERWKWMYDGSGNLIRDEYWQIENTNNKLLLTHASMFRYDGLETINSNPEKLPVVSNKIPFECQGPWKAEDVEGDSAYLFKK